MSQIPSYPSIYALGHRAVADLFAGDEVVIEEKFDGSQFSFAALDGVLHCRSKGVAIEIAAPDKLFAAAVEHVRSVFPLLRPEHVYRCECIARQKHNVLTYDRVPAGSLVLFDVELPGQNFMTPEQKYDEAMRLGIEPHQQLGRNYGGAVADLEGLLNRTSSLGGCKIEGVVVKNYARFGIDKKILIGKFVSPEFKEKHQQQPAKPGKADHLALLIAELRTEARWRKAVQHLRENGVDVGIPEAIGPLIREIQADVLKDETAFIQERLLAAFQREITNGIVRGFPEWFKQQLAEGQIS